MGRLLLLLSPLLLLALLLGVHEVVVDEVCEALDEPRLLLLLLLGVVMVMMVLGLVVEELWLLLLLLLAVGRHPKAVRTEPEVHLKSHSNIINELTPVSHLIRSAIQGQNNPRMPELTDDAEQKSRLLGSSLCLTELCM